MRTWRDRDRARIAWRASRCQSERGQLATTTVVVFKNMDGERRNTPEGNAEGERPSEVCLTILRG